MTPQPATPMDPSGLSIAAALERYEQTITPGKRSASAERYRIRVIMRSWISQILLPDLTPYHVTLYRDERLLAPNPQKPGGTVGPATVKHELMLLSHLFTIATSEWGIEGLDNPVAKVRKPRCPPGRNRRLKPGEEKKIIRACKAHPNRELLAFVELALETAARSSEIANLRWEYISFRKRVAHLPMTKNGDVRDLPLTRRAAEILQGLGRKNEGRVFESTGAGLKSAWRSITNELNIDDLHFHDLRHEGISRLFEKGLDSIEVAMISGHKSMQMLKRYTHLSAYKLVTKLDKADRKPATEASTADVMLAKAIRPYPAIMVNAYRFWHIEFPDFPEIGTVKHRQQTAVLAEAAYALLRHQVRSLQATTVLPAPSDEIFIRRSKSAESLAVSILPV